MISGLGLFTLRNTVCKASGTENSGKIDSNIDGNGSAKITLNAGSTGNVIYSTNSATFDWETISTEKDLKLYFEGDLC